MEKYKSKNKIKRTCIFKVPELTEHMNNLKGYDFEDVQIMIQNN